MQLAMAATTQGEGSSAGRICGTPFHGYGGEDEISRCEDRAYRGTRQHRMSLARCFDGACGPWGYCDASVGKCICAPGRGGADCSELLLGACRVHEMGEMACMTFTGLMSCECRLQCERRFGGVARRWAPVCWDYASPEMRAKYAPRLNLSDFPDGLPQAAVTFRSPSWPPLGRCAKPDPPRHCVVAGAHTAPHGQYPRRLAARQPPLSAGVLVARHLHPPDAAAAGGRKRPLPHCRR